MSDYDEEQKNEIEALESIYPDELLILEDDPFYLFEINVNSQGYPEDTENSVGVRIQFMFTPSYPDDLPHMKIKSSENLDEAGEAEVMEFIKHQAQESLGMVMVFNIISALTDKLNEMEDQLKKDKMEAVIREHRKREEADKKKFQGTAVSVETFLAWKTKFDAEMTEIKRQKGQVVEKGPVKLTGRELFMRDSTLDDSDVQFLQEKGDSVQIDESLFQDLEDLDLDTEDLDLDES